jgi:predicted branched-subunit amino acid permease
MSEGWPVMGTVLVVGTTFGVVARQSGLAPAEIAAMSVLVFAGASQFAMVGLFSEGAPTLIVVASVLIINLRHTLMAASLRSQLQELPLLGRVAAAFFLTDEAFAMATGHYRRGGRSLAYYFTFAISLYVFWNLATLVGIDFAITATFIGIVVLALRHRSDAIVAVVAALVAGGLALAGASTIAVITAGALAPLIAVFTRR